MKALLFTLLALVTTSAKAELQYDDIKDGQVISVIGWKNMMPVLGGPAHTESGGSLTVSYAAVSFGCTKPEDFKVEMKKMTPEIYTVSVSRTKIDICEHTPTIEIFKAKINADMELFLAFNQDKAKVLVEPYVSIGIAQ